MTYRIKHCNTAREVIANICVDPFKEFDADTEIVMAI